MGARLMAIVAEGERGRVYLPPTLSDGSRARTKRSREWKPDVEIFSSTQASVSRLRHMA